MVATVIHVWYWYV